MFQGKFKKYFKIFLKTCMPKHGVMKDKSIGIIIGSGKIIWLLGIESSLRNEEIVLFLA